MHSSTLLLLLICLCVYPLAIRATGQCENAAFLNVPGAITGNTSQSNPIGNSCSTNIAPASLASWHYVNGTGQLFYATTCDERTLIETRIAIFNTTFGGSLNCSDLSCAVSARTFNNEKCATISWFAETNQTYFVVVTGATSDVSGQYRLIVQTSPVQSCSPNATLLATTSDLIIYDDTSIRSAAMVPQAPTLASNVRGHWFRFVGDGRNISISTCNAGTNFDTALALFQQGACGTCYCATYLTWNDAASTGLPCSTLRVTFAQPAITYLLFVGGSLGSDMGAYNLSITRFNNQSATPVRPPMRPPVAPLPQGFSCIDSIPLELDVIQNHILSTSTPSTGLLCDNDRSADTRPGKWFKFNATVAGTYTITSCSSSTISYPMDTAVTVYDYQGSNSAACTAFSFSNAGSLQCGYSDRSTQGRCAAVALTARTNGTIFYAYMAASSSVALSFCRTSCSFQIRALRGTVFVPPPIIPPPPINVCSTSPQQVTLNTPYDASFLTANARPITPFPANFTELCGLTNTTVGVWYTMTGTGRDLYFSTCFSETTADTQLAVFRGSGCGSVICSGWSDDTSSISDCSLNRGTSTYRYTSSSSLNTLYIFIAKRPTASNYGLTGDNYRFRVSESSFTDSDRSSDSGLALGLGLGLPFGLFVVIFVVVWVILMRKRFQVAGALGVRLPGVQQPPRDDAVVIAYNAGPSQTTVYGAPAYGANQVPMQPMYSTTPSGPGYPS